MNHPGLRKKNLAFFRRYHRLVGAAAVIMSAVITGSLMVGDSVRNTLIRRVGERLGPTETVIFSSHSFLDQAILNRMVTQETPLHHAPCSKARGILLTNGFVSYSGRLTPVMVWGCDDLGIEEGSAGINLPLAREMKISPGEDIVLRLPASGLVPSGSLFVTENYTTSLRLAYKSMVGVDEGGNISLRNEHALPLNIFVNQAELAAALGAENKINLILSPRHITWQEFNKVWNASFSGMKNEEGIITCDRIFIPDEAVEAIHRTHPDAIRYFSYLANAIGDIPYSFISAADAFAGQTIPPDGIILSDYAAKRLHVSVGDSVTIQFFISQELKILTEESLRLRIERILPLAQFGDFPALRTDFPGLSNVEKCTDWNSDLPIHMHLITQEEEKYWELYRNTPKAIIAYETAVRHWKNAYGSATAIAIGSPALPDGLTPEMFGISIAWPRETGLSAAREGVDFSSLFLYLGFFIIISALLLMFVPLSEMLWQRREETALLLALGYTKNRITGMLWRESAPVVVVASLVGVVAGLLYTCVMMWLLGSVWRGATHTGGFGVYPDAATVAAGFLCAVAVAMAVLWIAVRRSLQEKRYREAPQRHGKTAPVIASATTAAALAVLIFAPERLGAAGLFMVSGILLLVATACWGFFIVWRKSVPQGDFGRSKMAWAPIYYSRRQALLSFFALASGVFIVFSVGLHRQGFDDTSKLLTGTGGYTLWCESSVAVHHNAATAAGRQKLGLTDLSPEATVVPLLRHGGDDASCLNLNKISNPALLGMEMEAMAGSGFEIMRSLLPGTKQEVFASMQRRHGEAYPVLVDETVLVWGLIKNLGDTLRYRASDGREVALIIAATLKNSIFQGHILMERELFSEIWSDAGGSNILLLKVPPEEKEGVAALVSTALSNYGMRVTATEERLREFNSVTDTYLTIFLTLGGIGLLLGIFGFIIAIRKNLASRKGEATMYRALGFTDSVIKNAIFRENIIVPLYAVASGTVAALAGAGNALAHAGVWVIAGTLLFAGLFVVCIVVFVRKLCD